MTGAGIVPPIGFIDKSAVKSTHEIWEHPNPPMVAYFTSLGGITSSPNDQWL